MTPYRHVVNMILYYIIHVFCKQQKHSGIKKPHGIRELDSPMQQTPSFHVVDRVSYSSERANDQNQLDETGASKRTEGKLKERLSSWKVTKALTSRTSWTRTGSRMVSILAPYSVRTCQKERPSTFVSILMTGSSLLKVPIIDFKCLFQ